MRFNLESLEYFAVLDILKKHAATNYAKEQIEQITPLSDINEVNIKLSETEEALQALVKYGDLPLGGLYSIKGALLRSSLGGTLKASEILDISQLITTTGNVLKYEKALLNQKFTFPFSAKYFNELILHDKLKNSIALIIDENGKVYDSATSKLMMIRKNQKLSEGRLRSKMNELLTSKASMLQESLIVYRNERMCLPVKAEFKNSFKGIIHDESASHTTVYIEPLACVEINAKLDSLINEEKKEIEEILRNLSLLIGQNSAELINNLENLTTLDVIYAKAKYALADNLTKPRINDEGIINIKGGRHPLIDKKRVVPIDISIGDGYKTIIITGPNTGGKTVALKTVGLLTCLMQSGIYIPCKENSTLAVFDQVFVDIGDEQSIIQSLSTFSSHMRKIIDIIENLTFNSLVLLDELGSGTDPKEGSSLAISIIDYLKKHGSTTIVTTHYTDLKTYAYNNIDICNASVEFDIDTLSPTYRLLMGIPGKSNAIEIAKRLGLNEEIIKSARENIKENANRADSLLEQLDNENQKISHIKESLQHKINEYNQLLEEVSDIKNNTIIEKNKIIKKAQEEADKIIAKSEEKITHLLNSLDDLKKQNNFKEHNLADLKYQARNLKYNESNIQPINQEYKQGDYVYLTNYQKTGVILKVKKDKYTVKMGNFTMDFTKDEMLLTNEPKTVEKVKVKPTGMTPSANASLRLDLRGLRYEEVNTAIDKFIDQAYLASMKSVQIIHGFGTGALREAVNQYLKTSSYVESYRYGKEGEGLNGVTVVYLK